MSGKLESIREIIVSDEMLFPDAKSLMGVVERQSAGGFILRATKTKTIVKYSAIDADGAPLKGEHLRMTDAASHANEKCFYCVTTGGHTYCTEVLCPEPA